MKTFEFLKIKFSDFKSNKIDILLNKNFLVFPSAPSLSAMKINSNHHKALQNADFVLLDSGLLVLLFNIFRGTNLKKFSGYKFLHLFLRRRKTRNEKILLINPDFKIQKNNINFIRKFIKDINLQLVHIHPNNYANLGLNNIPTSLEITFSKNPIVLSEKSDFPHPLDQPNNPLISDIELKFNEDF